MKEQSDEIIETKKRMIEHMFSVVLNQLVRFYPVHDDLIRSVVRNVFGEFASRETERRVKEQLDFLYKSANSRAVG